MQTLNGFLVGLNPQGNEKLIGESNAEDVMLQVGLECLLRNAGA